MGQERSCLKNGKYSNEPGGRAVRGGRADLEATLGKAVMEGLELDTRLQIYLLG